MTNTTPNPVVRATRLRAYPDWIVREYADGSFDAASTSGPGLTWGCDTFAHAVAAVRYLARGERGDILAVPGFAREA